MNSQHKLMDILHQLAFVDGYESYLQIPQEEITKFVKEKFPQLQPQCRKCLRQRQFFHQLKKLAENYVELAGYVSNYKQPNIEDQLKNDLENRRKVTRSVFALRNQKNQQQLRKDQIFVRVMPRSQSCIQFMLKNRNFPRIECKLSCNQHLQYLINFLTNKWLRGKVGMGYQIVLYPDGTKYLRKMQNQQRLEVVHEPLNNYLMFTDIMSACGVNQNGCLNLFYDITQLRKQKKKSKKPLIIATEKEKYKSPQKNQLEKPLNILEHPDQISLGPKEMSLKVPSFKHNEHNIDDSSLFGSLGYHWRSNLMASNFFNNNSNTFLNGELHEQQQKSQNQKLQNLRSYISMVEKEADQPEKNENSIQKEEKTNKKEVKTVVITKKKTLEN